MKKNNLILFSLLVLFISVLPIFSWDDTHEKPQEFKKPDRHRIFIRGNIGGGSAKTPEVDEEKGINNYVALLSGGSIIPRSIIASSLTAGFGTGSLEYRFDDKIRLMYDYRKVGLAESNSFSTTNYSLGSTVNFNLGSTSTKIKGWEETTRKLGIAYYFPIGNHLSLGAMARKYDVTQSYNRSDGGTSIGTSGILFENAKSNYESNFSGIVPGFGIEIKPTRWFEIIFTHEIVKLTGTQVGNNLDSLIGSTTSRTSSGSFVSTPVNSLSVNVLNTNLTYSGRVQNLDFVFRYTSWFSTRYGFTEERYTRKFENYFVLSPSGSLAGSVLNAVLYPAFTKSEVIYRNFHIIFEFSKGFN